MFFFSVTFHVQATKYVKSHLQIQSNFNFISQLRSSHEDCIYCLVVVSEKQL